MLSIWITTWKRGKDLGAGGVLPYLKKDRDDWNVPTGPGPFVRDGLGECGKAPYGIRDHITIICEIFLQ